MKLKYFIALILSISIFNLYDVCGVQGTISNIASDLATQGIELCNDKVLSTSLLVGNGITAGSAGVLSLALAIPMYYEAKNDVSAGIFRLFATGLGLTGVGFSAVSLASLFMAYKVASSSEKNLDYFTSAALFSGAFASKFLGVLLCNTSGDCDSKCVGMFLLSALSYLKGASLLKKAYYKNK